MSKQTLTYTTFLVVHHPQLHLFLEHCVSVVPWADEAQGVVCTDMAAVVQVHSLFTKSS